MHITLSMLKNCSIEVCLSQLASEGVEIATAL